jgi:excisionase family DNA binding protein
MTLIEEMERDPLLTSEEVADIFRVERSTIVRWALRELLPTVRTPGDHYRFRQSAVKAALQSGLRDDTP